MPWKRTDVSQQRVPFVVRAASGGLCARRWPVGGCGIKPVDRLLLVSYRHMYIREIDRRRRLSRPLVLKGEGG